MKANQNLFSTFPAPGAASRGHGAPGHVINVAGRARASSAELKLRRLSRGNFRKPGLVFPSAVVTTLPSPTPFAKRFQTPERRMLVSRNYKRELRASERPVQQATGHSTHSLLREQALNAARFSPNEKRAFATIALFAGAAIILGLADSFRLVEIWERFAATLRLLIG